MRKVYFEKAGKVNMSDRVFLTSNSRASSSCSKIFHRNDWHTSVHIPNDIFKEHFTFDRVSGIYRNDLTYRELKDMGAKVHSFSLK